ncbi:Glucose-repressible alcohol dehydrogenase transcriptional effector [Smittium mucronatum]|uniref:Glucose-repressible alcohol dehydrogenase transcriptional effector n=1 Tax=Smittium mucronatum TaxID=133383 RepID=A0A1R0H0N9_9FUNG|nr:Glucose-repressible alcohol dehydrogenase transcriptional effector [Smittium mucronatum]
MNHFSGARVNVTSNHLIPTSDPYNSTNAPIMNHQINMENRIIYPSSQHHQIQLTTQQRSRASATPHHHSKAAMALQRNQANLSAMMSSNSIVTSGYQNRSITPYSQEDVISGIIQPQNSSAVLISSPSNHPSKQNGKKTPITPQLLRANTTNSFPGSSSANRGSKSADPNSFPNNNSQTASKQKIGTWSALDMGGIGIHVLSKELFNYSFLTKLYINHNQLSFIPDSISKLACLEVLDASGNNLTSVPSSLGICCNLKELLLFDNRIVDLPFELGNLYLLETLGLEGNPLTDPLRSLLQKDGTRATIEYLRDMSPVSKAPDDRKWIVVDKSVDQNSENIVSIVSYNVLCSQYASPSHYGYCPSWALSWDTRKETIMSELLSLNSDIICLQEVEACEHEDFFNVKLKEAGYDGVFWAKSRARTMSEKDRKSVDGCSTFYKSSMFSLVASHLLEFQPSALKRSDFKKSEDFFNRFMTKDNICGYSVLKHKHIEGNPKVVVTNAHIHWDPEYTDVKMVQSAMMMEELGHVVEKYAVKNQPLTDSGSTKDDGKGLDTDTSNNKNPENEQNMAHLISKVGLLICGDFNSTPGSGLYEFLSTSKLNKSHFDLEKLEHYSDYAKCGLAHDFSLKSAYASIGEMNCTNYTPTFKGVIDYIWYSTGTLHPTGLLGPIDKDWLTTQVGFPNAHIPSDHIPLMAEFLWRQ